jgi:hypothetical protein
LTNSRILTFDPGIHAGIGYGEILDGTLSAILGTIDLTGKTPEARCPELIRGIEEMLLRRETPSKIVLLDSTRYSRGKLSARSQLFQIAYLYGYFARKWPNAQCIIEIEEIKHRQEITGGRSKKAVVDWAKTHPWFNIRWLTDHELDALVSLVYWTKEENRPYPPLNIFSFKSQEKK